MDKTFIQEKDNKGKAIAPLMLGLVSIIVWFIPLFGLSVTVVGLVIRGVSYASKNEFNII